MKHPVTIRLEVQFGGHILQQNLQISTWEVMRAMLSPEALLQRAFETLAKGMLQRVSEMIELENAP